MEFHEFASIFPMMQPGEFRDLVDDIKKNGLVEPIVLCGGKILDGRNRWMACNELGIEPKFEQYTGSDPVGYIVSKNLHRRHLTETQRGVIGDKIANMRQGERTDLEPCTNLYKVSVDQAADLLSISRGTVYNVRTVKREAPELIPKLESGEMTAGQAIAEIKRKQVLQQLEDISIKEAKAIEGVYDVIVIDPPWPMKKIERDVAPGQVEFEYPTMTIDEIKALEIPCANDCHVWLWTTHKYLPDALDILKAWDLKYVCTFVWHKPGGFQPFGLPQYNAEFALYARRGSPAFTSFTDFKLCFDAPRTGHSEKPEAFYDLVRRVTAGRRLDMFGRRSIDEFDAWGKEAV